MTDNYYRQIRDLTDWYTERIADLPPVALSKAQYRRGIDILPQAYLNLSREAFYYWLRTHNYELSYSQSCVAMFKALERLGKLAVDGVTNE